MNTNEKINPLKIEYIQPTANSTIKDRVLAYTSDMKNFLVLFPEIIISENYVEIQSVNNNLNIDEIVIPTYLCIGENKYTIYLPEDCTDLFYGCRAEKIDLSYVLSCDNIDIMDGMFEDCFNLKHINFGNADLSQVYSFNDIFAGSSKIDNKDKGKILKILYKHAE